jgi:ATP-dependent HslUV protease, peptidase subunit HslV
MFEGTTILAVRKDGKTVIGGDGQVTLDKVVLKHGACKLRRLYEDRVIVGFAGSTADAFTLFERFDAKLKEHNGQLVRASVELGKDWRTDKMLRQLQALLIVADKQHILLLSGSGDVVEPDEDAVAIGSGGSYAIAAAKALLRHGNAMSAEDIVRASLKIASEICIYTNDHITVETL